MTGYTKYRLETIMEVQLNDDTILPIGSEIKFTLEFPWNNSIMNYGVIAVVEHEDGRLEGKRIKNTEFEGSYYLSDLALEINKHTIYHVVNGFINGQFQEDVTKVTIEILENLD